MSSRRAVCSLAEEYPSFVFATKNRRGWVARLVFPEDLNLGTNHLSVASSVDVIRGIAKAGVQAYWDFSKVRWIDDGAALVIAAEIDRVARLRFGGRLPRVRKDRRWDPNTERVLGEMGFFDLLRVTNPPVLPANDGSRRYVRFLTGQGSSGVDIRILKQRYANAVGDDVDIDPADPNDRRPVYDALMEAMTNVSHHAYPPESAAFSPELRERWWVGGSYDPANHRFTIAFYDAGIGIPVSLTATRPAEQLARAAKLFRGQYGDAERIVTAIATQSSRTRQSHRGKGLVEIRELAKKRPPAEVRILSGTGEYQMSYGVGRTAQKRSPVVRNHAMSIPGTLIWWEASL